jgi:hypothetical protein
MCIMFRRDKSPAFAALAWVCLALTASGPAAAGLLTLTDQGGAPDGWTSAEAVGDEIQLDKGFTFGSWDGFIEFNAPAGATGNLFATLFLASTPFQGIATIIGPDGFNLVVTGGAAQVSAPVVYREGLNRFDFSVTGTSAPWRLNTVLTAGVPAPGPLALLLPALLGMAWMRRRRARNGPARGYQA